MPAYADPWDTATPAGTEEQRQGDDRMREMKRALEQRLDTAMNFSTSTDDITDPVVLNADTVPPGALQDGAINSFTEFGAAMKTGLRRALEVDYTPTSGIIAAGAVFTENVPVPGAVAGDAVLVVLPTDAPVGAHQASIKGYVSAPDVVTVVVVNHSAAGITPFVGGGIDWRVLVLTELP